MENDDEYAIVSKKEFLALKKELERIKKNPLEGSPVGENLQDSIDNLNTSVNSMLEVFKQASQEMGIEEHDTQLVSKQIGPLQEKIDTLIEQNQKIAKGIVAIADMVREKLDEIEARSSRMEREAGRPASDKRSAALELPPLSGGPMPVSMGQRAGAGPGSNPPLYQGFQPQGLGGFPPIGMPGSMPLPEEIRMSGAEAGQGGMEFGGLPPMPALPPQGSPTSGVGRTSVARSPILGGLLKR
ncbi:hypothetical protein HZB03_05485 [Candidatus Woesearchaeota archaeon]|nr:hypothetical protein [Candidatus Woesearchaeota archaeon]